MSISRDTFDPSKNYRRIRYHQRRDLLDSELNEQQDIASHDQQQLFDVLFAQGSITQGLLPTVNGAEVTLTDGRPTSMGISCRCLARSYSMIPRRPPDRMMCGWK